MLGFKSMSIDRIVLTGIELIHMIRKQQGDFTTSMALPNEHQFAAPTA